MFFLVHCTGKNIFIFDQFVAWCMLSPEHWVLGSPSNVFSFLLEVENKTLYFHIEGSQQKWSW